MVPLVLTHSNLGDFGAGVGPDSGQADSKLTVSPRGRSREGRGGGARRTGDAWGMGARSIGFGGKGNFSGTAFSRTRATEGTGLRQLHARKATLATNLEVFGAFCLDVRTLTFCQLVGFPVDHQKLATVSRGAGGATEKSTDPCSKTIFLLGRGFVRFHVSGG